jgi:protein TonB
MIWLRKLKPVQRIALLIVLSLHGAGLYGLWRYRMIPPQDESVTLIANLINTPVSDKPKLVDPPKLRLRPIVPADPIPLAVQMEVVKPNEAVAYVLAVPLPSPSTPEPPQDQPQVVALSGELSVSCPDRSPPVYPTLSMRLNEQGRVVLRVELGVDGRISNVSFKTHSGYTRLDDAAVNAVKTWHCKPAIRGGVPLPALALQPFDFILEGR